MASTAYRPVKLIGYCCLVVTALGWGLNWPATKFLLAQCPPLTARGIAGIVAGLTLAGIALLRGETLRVPRQLRLRLLLLALLNVSAWMGLTTLSLVWLSAGEAATLAYTMPVWAALLAWPVLGERLALRRIAALALGIGGITVACSAEMGSAAIWRSCRAWRSHWWRRCCSLWALCSPNVSHCPWHRLR